ncbi:MAG: M48 family metalloprotease [Nitrospinae bacterium]|nr:M48 family metalloprotease [Nitrospinota bacterium]
MKKLSLKIKLLFIGIFFLIQSNRYLLASEIEPALPLDEIKIHDTGEYLNIKSIGSRIAEASKIDVRVIITKEGKADACVYPDGTIVLTEGLINLAANDSEIAFVIAHEVGHITMGHYRQEIVYSMLDDLSFPERAKEEVEADLHGAVFMQMAGYDPASAVSLLIKMLETRSDASAYFSERIDTLNHFISQYNKE